MRDTQGMERAMKRNGDGRVAPGGEPDTFYSAIVLYPGDLVRARSVFKHGGPVLLN